MLNFFLPLALSLMPLTNDCTNIEKQPCGYIYESEKAKKPTILKNRKERRFAKAILRKRK